MEEGFKIGYISFCEHCGTLRKQIGVIETTQWCLLCSESEGWVTEKEVKDWKKKHKKKKIKK